MAEPHVDQPAFPMGAEVLALPGALLTEAERRPLIDAAGRELLERLHRHPMAPRYNHTCGDRLTPVGLDRARAFDAEVRTAAPAAPGGEPPWLPGFVAHALTHVPVYRDRARRAGLGPTAPFALLPTTTRDDLVADPYAFVPDDHPLDEMVVYTTTGTSDGRVAYVASDPATVASYAALLRAAVATRGRTLDGGPGRVAVAQVCWQRHTYTYASVSTFLGQAGIVKLNLNPDEWRDPAHVAGFIDALDPEVLTGDPVAFAHLAELPVTVRPTALLSSAMTLTDGARDALEARFGCPAIDVYGMTEAGPIAAAVPGRGHVVLQPRLHVEILDPDGRPVPDGERGEVVLTGGFNPAFPLLRYRTGDHAARSEAGGRTVLLGLEGRAPVAFRSADGRAVNTIDVTVALTGLPLARSHVHQDDAGALDVGVQWIGTAAPGEIDRAEASVRAALGRLFGAVPIVLRDVTGEPEQVRYRAG